jgi:hypothetical protein
LNIRPSFLIPARAPTFQASLNRCKLGLTGARHALDAFPRRPKGMRAHPAWQTKRGYKK